jgi:hypothetical protein
MRSFLEDTRGNVAVLFGMTLVPMLVTAGMQSTIQGRTALGLLCKMQPMQRR